MKLKSDLKIYRDKIVIYYSENGKILRKETKIKVEKRDQKIVSQELKSEMLTGKYKQFYEYIIRLKDKYDKIIIDYWVRNDKAIPVNKLKEYVESDRTIDTTIVSTLFKKFLSKKEKLFNTDSHSKESIKCYSTLYNTLLDYQLEKNVELTVTDLTYEFVCNFCSFLESQRKPTKNKIYYSKGKLKASVVKKRFATFKEFVKYLEFEEDKKVNSAKFNHWVKELNLKKKIKKPKKVALNSKQVSELKNIKASTLYEQKVLDLFYFTCNSGLRWADVITLNRRHLSLSNGRHYITKTTGKTEAEVKFHLRKDCFEIFKKYNYDLCIVSNGGFNRKIKKILSTNKLFNFETKHNKNKLEKYKFYELVTFHIARHTLISILMNSNKYPISQIMKITGHTQISTLNKYLHEDDENINLDEI